MKEASRAMGANLLSHRTSSEGMLAMSSSSAIGATAKTPRPATLRGVVTTAALGDDTPADVSQDASAASAGCWSPSAAAIRRDNNAMAWQGSGFRTRAWRWRLHDRWRGHERQRGAERADVSNAHTFRAGIEVPLWGAQLLGCIELLLQQWRRHCVASSRLQIQKWSLARFVWPSATARRDRTGPRLMRWRSCLAHRSSSMRCPTQRASGR